MKFLEKKISGKIKITLPLLVLLFFTIVFLGQGLATPVFKGYSAAGNISPDNGTQYNPANLYNFTVNITDSINGTGFIKNVTFQLGLPNGSYVNYTNNASNNLSTGPKPGPFNISKVWWMNFTQSQIGPAGSYNFTWSAYNNSGSYNHSSTVVYNISKNQTNPVNLEIENTTNPIPTKTSQCSIPLGLT